MFKKKSPSADPNAAYALPSDLLDAAATLAAALDARSQVDAAIARNASVRQAAGDARQSAEAEVERLELALALETDETKIASMEAAVSAARSAAQEAGTNFGRAHRLQGALYTKAPDADAQIDAARQTFQSALGLYGIAANETLTTELREAAQPLIRVLARGHALASAIGSLSAHGGLLGDVLIPNSAPSQPAIIAGRRAQAMDGSAVDLAADWKATLDALALAEVIQPISELRQRLGGHRVFVPPPPPPAKPYEVSHQNRLAAEHDAAIEAREVAADAAAPKPQGWQGRSWKVEFGANSPMPTVGR